MSNFSPFDEVYGNQAVDPMPVGWRSGDLFKALRIAGAVPADRTYAAELERQTAQCFANMAATVEAAGGSINNIAHVSFYLTSPRDDMPTVNAAWTEMFPDEDDRPTYKFVPYTPVGPDLLQATFYAVLGERRRILNLPVVAHTNPIPMGVRIGDYLFSSRVLPFDPATGDTGDDAASQAEFVFANMTTLLKLAEMEWADASHGRAFLAEPDEFDRINKMWVEHCGAGAPPLHMLPYRAGPLQVMLELFAVKQ